MFDNKKEPQDIFEGVEPPVNLPVADIGAPTPAPVALTAPPSTTPPTAPSSAHPTPVMTPPSATGKIIQDRDLGSGGHLWKTILIVAIAFLAMGLAAFLAFRFMNPPNKDKLDDRDGATQDKSDDSEAGPDGKSNGGRALEDDEPEVKIVLDTDGDGLTNDEELQAGTSASKPDSDSDLLGDREEVQVYGTDPLRADTDGDTFTDGQEVRSGYNPNGPGKILKLPTE